MVSQCPERLQHNEVCQREKYSCTFSDGLDMVELFIRDKTRVHNDKNTTKTDLLKLGEMQVDAKQETNHQDQLLLDTSHVLLIHGVLESRPGRLRRMACAMLKRPLRITLPIKLARYEMSPKV